MSVKSYRATVILLVLLMATSIVLSCGNPEYKRRNLLLITVDTLRPDRLGYYGHTRNTSGFINDLARYCVIYEKCYSVAGWTLPSIATIFTGRYPREHGAVEFYTRIRDDIPTLATILEDQGYDTRAYVSHVILGPNSGLARGFKKYDTSVLDVGTPEYVTTSRELTQLVFDDLKDIKEPFFIWVHYFDPHFLYLAYKEVQYGDEDIDRYDAEIAHNDYYIGKLLTKFKEMNLFDSMVIVFTSDHGEEFGEHGGKYHYTLHEEVLRVPLLIKAPYTPSRFDKSTVEQIDLLPTILFLLKVDYDKNLPGRNLFGRAEDNPAVFLERDRPPAWHQRAVIMDDYKLINIRADTTKSPEYQAMTFAKVTNVRPGTYLYNLKNDSGEENNLFSPDDSISMLMLKVLDDYVNLGIAPSGFIEIDEELKDKLRRLGYIQ
jgi:arylsulfatase A-like enzyme